MPCSRRREGDVRLARADVVGEQTAAMTRQLGANALERVDLVVAEAYVAECC
jgi:hypothetical protein